MDIGKAFEVAFKRKKEKNWERIYVVVDIHDTILRACYENEETFDYYLYEVKLYFNVGIDDKFGFEAETDWVKVIEVLGRF